MNSLPQWQRLSQARRMRLEAACDLWRARSGRDDQPDGELIRGRWYPSESERRPCCDLISRPSRRYPYTIKDHCRSLKHIAHLMDCDYRFLIRRQRERSIESVNLFARDNPVPDSFRSLMRGDLDEDEAFEVASRIVESMMQDAADETLDTRKPNTAAIDTRESDDSLDALLSEMNQLIDEEGGETQ